jgi:hypothetical protein
MGADFRIVSGATISMGGPNSPAPRAPENSLSLIFDHDNIAGPVDHHHKSPFVYRIDHALGNSADPRLIFGL